jgi:hypothetical protein
MIGVHPLGLALILVTPVLALAPPIRPDDHLTPGAITADATAADVCMPGYAQADALRRRAANELDWDNIAEEIEDVGIGEINATLSRIDNSLRRRIYLLGWPDSPSVRRWQAELDEFARPKTYAAWPVWSDSTTKTIRFQPIPKKEATKLWHRARDFDRRTHQPGKHGGNVGHAALQVLHALIFDFLNYRTGQLDPSYEAMTKASDINEPLP